MRPPRARHRSCHFRLDPPGPPPGAASAPPALGGSSVAAGQQPLRRRSIDPRRATDCARARRQPPCRADSGPGRSAVSNGSATATSDSATMAGGAVHHGTKRIPVPYLKGPDAQPPPRRALPGPGHRLGPTGRTGQGRRSAKTELGRGSRAMVRALNRANPLAAGTAPRRATALSQVELRHAASRSASTTLFVVGT